jgi:hypothetical protein
MWLLAVSHFFFRRKCYDKKKKSIDLAAQSGAANEVVSRYGSASKEHLVSYSGVDSQYINGIKIWNK